MRMELVKQQRKQLDEKTLPQVLLDLAVVGRHVDHPCPLAAFELLQHLDLLSHHRIGGIILLQWKVLGRYFDVFLLIVVQCRRFNLEKKGLRVKINLP